MTFLHAEFFLWMVLPAGILFYFWQTQKPFENRWLGEEVMQKLRAPEMTMGLKGRNTLFLIAALLLITAMAQPVLPEPFASEESRGHIVFAVQTGTRSDEDFERVQKLALRAMGAAAGNEMAVVAFDERVYRVAPLSDDFPVLSLLVRNLPRSAEGFDPAGLLSAAAGAEGDVVAVIAAEEIMIESERFILLDDTGDIALLLERIEKYKEAQRMAAHIPLFYYPLGLAMILIWIALSSMSKRRSVGVAALVGIIAVLQPPAAEAGLVDFALLHEAREAYEQGEYARSAALFARYQQNHNTPQVRYNRANALYKAGRYKQAEFWYRHVYTDDPRLEQRRRYNLAQTLKQIALGGEKGALGGEAQRPPERAKNLQEGRTGGEGRFTTRLFRLD